MTDPIELDEYFVGRPIRALRHPAVKPRLFLSYGRDDDSKEHTDPEKSFTRRLYNDLVAKGFEVWWDREKMPSRGLTFLREIRMAVDACDRLLLLVGTASNASEYVKAEWEHALATCKPVIPLLRNGDYSDVPKPLQQFHVPDCRENRPYVEVFDELLRVLGEDEAPLATLYGVPPPPAGNIDRKQLPDLLKLLRPGEDRPIVVTSMEHTITLRGIAGIGKSTLVASAALTCEVRRSFPDGIFWLSITKRGLIAQRMADIGSVFGDPHDKYEDEFSGRVRLSNLLHDKAALFILDDVWSAEAVRAFQGLGEHCAVIATTRLGNIEIEVGGIKQELDGLDDEEGISLIRASVGELGDEPILRAIVRKLSGHTLAVSIAAKWLVERGIDTAGNLLGRLDQGRMFHDLKVEDRNLNLELSLKISYDNLDSENQTLRADLQRRFRALGIFPLGDTFDKAIAGAIWDDNKEYTVEDALNALVRAGLLTRLDSNLYTQHTLLREYARAMLMHANELTSTFDHYADYVIQQAKQFEALPLEEWGKLDPLLPHLREVGDALTKYWETGPDPNSINAALTKRCNDFAYFASYYIKNRRQMIETPRGREWLGLRWLEMGQAVNRYTEDRDNEALFCGEIGNIWTTSTDFRRAIPFYEQALSIYKDLNNRAGAAIMLSNIGFCWHSLKDLDIARHNYEGARSEFHALGNPTYEATALVNIGTVWFDSGRLDEALNYFEQARSLNEIENDQYAEFSIRHNFGKVYFQRGEWKRSLDFRMQSLEIARAQGMFSHEAVACHAIALVCEQLGNCKQAIEFAETGRTILERHNLPYDAAGTSIEAYNELIERLRKDCEE